MIRLEKITKKYNDVSVLNNITLNFRKKEIVAILGPSGSGKSTLLNIISAIESPDSGKLYFGKHDVFKMKKTSLDKYRNNYIDYIFQTFNLIDYLNVKDNLNLSTSIKGNKVKEFKLNEVLDNLKINKISKGRVNLLSGGEKQRAAIARSIINNPKILLCDEPTGSLDSKNAYKIMEILKQISSERLVIIVTHNEELASKFASRIIRISDGEIIKDTNPYYENNQTEYKFVKNKLSYFQTLNLAFKNIKNKRLRTFLTTFAYSIGLISLAFVLSISSGFNQEIKKFEKEVLFDYPLVISKESITIDNLFSDNNKEYKEGIINIVENPNHIVTNDINNELINKINNLDNISGVSYYKNINSQIKDYLYPIPSNNYFELLSGSYPQNNQEVLILLDSNNSVNQTLANYLNIEEVNFSNIVNKELIINNQTLLISGVVQSKNNYFKDAFGILHHNDTFDEEITDVYIYPENYEAKKIIIKELSAYNIIDESDSVIKIIKNFIRGVSYILIAFSIIALIVSILMINIISYISVLERQKEIGIIKSLGGSSQDVKKIFLSENIIIGLISSMITLNMTSTISKIINSYVYEKLSINNIVHFNQEIIIFVIFISILLSYLAGIIPARIASKKKVIDILKHE